VAAADLATQWVPLTDAASGDDTIQPFPISSSPFQTCFALLDGRYNAAPNWLTSSLGHPPLLTNSLRRERDDSARRGKGGYLITLYATWA
jgi:hypothetical protein